MIRVPQNGGVATGKSAATSERSGSCTGFALAFRSAAIFWDRSRRALRSAFFRCLVTSSVMVSPRLRAMISSMRLSPSNASRA